MDEPTTAPTTTAARFFHKLDFPADETELRALARRCRILFALDPRELAIVKDENPAVIALPYRNMWGHIFDEVPPDDAPDVLKHPDGRVLMAGDGWPPKLRDLRAERAAERMLEQLATYRAAGFDGCFYDIAHPRAWDRREAATVDEKWSGHTDELWPGYAAASIDRVELMLRIMTSAGSAIVTNSVPRSREEGEGKWGAMGSRVQIASTGVQLDIAFLRGSWDAPLRAESDLVYQLETMLVNQAAGRFALYKTPAEGKRTPAAAETWFACYLLAVDGEHALAKAAAGPIQDAPVGMIVEPYSAPASAFPVYHRHFTNGLALVNPAKEPREVTLSRHYVFARDGSRAPRILEVPAGVGIILLEHSRI